MKLILDVETFALAEANDYLEDVAAPANYKDAEKIAAYIAQKRQEALSRCALEPDLCQVVTIGRLDDQDGDLTVQAVDAFDERDLLTDLWGLVRDRTVTLVGFNLLSFDLPVLIRRSQYLGVSVPDLNLDRYRTPHVDLLERLTFNGKLKMRSLGFYCRRFGIEVDDPYEGADIDALVRANDWPAITAHCRADILKTAALGRRLGYFDRVAPRQVVVA